MTWGNAALGGDSSAVQGQLKNVRRSKPLAVLLLPFLAMDRW